MVLSNAYRFVVFRFSFTTNIYIYIYMASISVGYIYQTYIYIYKCVCIYIRIIKIHIYINIYLYSPIYSSLDSIHPQVVGPNRPAFHWNLRGISWKHMAHGRHANRCESRPRKANQKKMGGERKAQNNGPGIPETILPKEMITFHASLQGCKGIVWCHFFIFWVFIGILNKGDILKKSLHIG